MAVTLVLLILNMFTRIPLLYLLALVFLGYGYFRMFSRNISKRSSENYAYLQKTERIRAWFGKMKRRIVQSRDYHIYKCPSCRTEDPGSAWKRKDLYHLSEVPERVLKSAAEKG